MAIYDNCIIQAPDGVNLSRCGLKKLNWYLRYNLADKISDNPPTIRLRFEPQGRQGLEDPLLLDGKPNICVVCGVDDELTRHHIVPYSFIRYMRVEYKVDIIRDIFPLCRYCHNEYEKKSWDLRQEIARRMEIPIYGLSSEMLTNIRKATKAASALLRHRNSMPQQRIEHMESIVKDFLKVNELTTEQLASVSNQNIRERDDYTSFSKQVAEKITDYNAFAREWRTHFVETMKPRFMPEAWKIDRLTVAENIWVPDRMKKQN